LSAEEIVHVEIPTGMPMVYKFNARMEMVEKISF